MSYFLYKPSSVSVELIMKFICIANSLNPQLIAEPFTDSFNWPLEKYTIDIPSNSTYIMTSGEEATFIADRMMVFIPKYRVFH